MEYDQEHTKKYTECMLNQFRAVWESTILSNILYKHISAPLLVSWIHFSQATHFGGNKLYLSKDF